MNVLRHPLVILYVWIARLLLFTGGALSAFASTRYVGGVLLFTFLYLTVLAGSIGAIVFRRKPM